jgi:hypothetical protein
MEEGKINEPRPPSADEPLKFHNSTKLLKQMRNVDGLKR